MTLVCREFAFGSPAYQASLRLRDEILRKPLGLVLEPSELDGDDDSIHLGCFSAPDQSHPDAQESLAGSLILKHVDPATIKMRQVAVATDFQRHGVGTLLVRFAEAFAKEAGYRTMVAHARAAIITFYVRQGYTIEGEGFTEVTIPHFRIVKALDDKTGQSPAAHCGTANANAPGRGR